MNERIKELAEQALFVLKAWDALIKHQYSGSSEAMTDMQVVAWRTVDMIAELEAELAKPEQGEMMQIKDGHLSYLKKPWVGLTDEEIISSSKFFDYMTNEELIDAVRELEAKLRSKNNG